MQQTPEEQVLNEMNKLGFPNVFSTIWYDNQPTQFCHHWKKPSAFFEYRLELIQRCPRLADCIPLLESNRDHLVAFEPSTGKYLDFYFDEVEIEEVGDSYQQFLTSLFVDFGYAGLMDVVESVSANFEYSHLDELSRFMEVDDELSAEDSKRRFVSSIVD